MAEDQNSSKHDDSSEDEDVEQSAMAHLLAASSMSQHNWIQAKDRSLDHGRDEEFSMASSSTLLPPSPAVWSVPVTRCVPMVDQKSGSNVWAMPTQSMTTTVSHLSSPPSWSISLPSTPISSFVQSAPPSSVVSTEATGSSNSVHLMESKDEYLLHREQHDQSIDIDYAMGRSSPEDNEENMQYPSASRFYKCRFCHFSAMTYTQLQLHMPKHGGVKALKCPLCDYTTNDKSNFRRHRRLHQRNNPVSVLRCGKCSYSTILPKKIREHYSQQHNEHYVPAVGEVPSYISPGFEGTPYRIRQMDVGHDQCSSANGSISSNALYSLIGCMQSSALNYGHTNRQPVASCIGPYGAYHNPTGRRHSEDGHMASNYLRSIVSSIMNTHHSSRVPATSTITSSSYYCPPTVGSSDNMALHNSSLFPADCQMQVFPDRDIKVKIEPIDFDRVSDMSSSATPHSNATPEAIHHKEGKSSYYDMRDAVVDRFNEATSSGDANIVNSTQSNCSKRDERSSSDTSAVNTTVKIEKASVGIQCSLPVIKTESMPILGDRFGQRLNMAALPVDRAVQCELLATGPSRRPTYRAQSVASESEVSEQQSSTCGDTRCCHCGVTFEDEVLFSIHIGCHSHTDPFACNVCGKQCSNKYGFYSHIMRGHQF